MSVENMNKAVVKQKIQNLYSTTFVQKWVFLPAEVKKQIESLDDLDLKTLNLVSAAIFAARYRTVHDIAIALNEFVELSNGDIEMKITKECEWDGYINGTEEPIKAVLTEGTVINLLEFLEAPHEGLIFQLTLGSGSEGKHFNITMDEAFDHIELLVEFVNQAFNRRLMDKETLVDDDFYIGEITPEVQEKLEAKHGKLKVFEPAPPLKEHEMMEIKHVTEEETDGAE